MKIAIAGSSGRMGRMLIEAVLASGDLRLHGALDVASSPLLGQDAGAFLGRQTGVPITADLDTALAGADALIDFTRPEGTMVHLQACERLGVKAVIGTTGFSDAQKVQVAAHAQRIALVMAPNMSVGVNVVLRLLDVAARALSQGYDIEVVEAHHRHKVDAPSGTALKMGEVLATALGRDLKDCAVYAREGHTGERDRPRRRHRRRPHRAVRRHRRAHRDHAPQQQPRRLCPGQPARGTLSRPARQRPVRHGRRAGALRG